MRGFTELRDLYFDGLRLCEELERIPSECCCRGQGAGGRGECSCSSQAEESEADGSIRDGCRSALEMLRRSVGVFRHYARRDRPKLSSKGLAEEEFGKEFFLIEDAIRFIGEAVDRIEDDLDEVRSTSSTSSSAHPALLRLKTRGVDLRKYLERLNNPSLLEAEGAVIRSGPKVSTTTAPEDAESVTTMRHAITFDTGISEPTVEGLKAIARKHSVYYEVWPEWSLVGNERVKTGYSLELYGANAHEDGREGCHLGPGSRMCRETFEDMRKIARWIMPSDERISRYEIEPFSQVIHIAPKQRKSRSEVVLTVKILLQREINQPVDDCERKCLKEMKGKLSELGIVDSRLPPHSVSQTEATAGR